MKKQKIAALTVGSALAAAALSPFAHAADNPFSAKPLTAGYQLAQADKKSDGKCGEAKCGASMMKSSEKKAEGKCGEAKCGAEKKADKKMDGKCGEAKCGASKK